MEKYKKDLKKAIQILEDRKLFLIKDKKGWSEKEKEVARAEITILQQLLEYELEKEK